MPICELCRGLTIEKLYPPNIYYHAACLATLERSGDDCRICAFMYWCLTRTDEASCFREESFFTTATRPRLAGYLPIDSHTSVAQLKLQIVAEPARKAYSSRNNDDGFTHIGMWWEPGSMVTDMTLVVEEGTTRIILARNEDLS